MLELLARSMRRPDDERFGMLFAWKHREGAFGASPAWVAVEDGAVVGYRAFLRWRFVEGDGRRVEAVRAVDTATHPDHQGRGVFRALTLHGLEAVADEGVGFVFNTPNGESRPGYLKMGWETIGTLRPRVRLARPRSIARVARGRAAAGHWGEPCSLGTTAAEAFHDEVATSELLAASTSTDARIRTDRSPGYLRWRYDERLGYRVVGLGRDVDDGVACFRVRRRGRALEATIGDLLVPGGSASTRRRLISAVVRGSGADHALVLDGSLADATVPLPGQGPTLVWRALGRTDAPPLDRWSLTMGDIELF